jgi:hypothetical protein
MGKTVKVVHPLIELIHYWDKDIKFWEKEAKKRDNKNKLDEADHYYIRMSEVRQCRKRLVCAMKEIPALAKILFDNKL